MEEDNYTRAEARKFSLFSGYDFNEIKERESLDLLIPKKGFYIPKRYDFEKIQVIPFIRDLIIENKSFNYLELIGWSRNSMTYEETAANDTLIELVKDGIVWSDSIMNRIDSSFGEILIDDEFEKGVKFDTTRVMPIKQSRTFETNKL
jgi:hypothetical protein